MKLSVWERVKRIVDLLKNSFVTWISEYKNKMLRFVLIQMKEKGFTPGEP